LTGAALGWWVVPLAALGAVLVVVFAGRRRLVAPVLAVLVATALGAWRGVPPPDTESLPWADGATAVRGRVVEHASNGRTQRVRVEVDAVRGRGTERWIVGDGCVRVSAPLHPALQLGDETILRGRVEPLADQRPAFQGYLRAQGCGGTMTAGPAVLLERGSGWRVALAAARRKIDEALGRAAPGDVGALLAGLVTGNDAALSPARQDAFERTGTTHLTAVSGSNIAVVLAIFATLGSASGWRRRLVWQVTTVVAVWGYSGIVGFQPPATRAAVVATAAVLASRTGRRPDYVTLVVLAGAVLVAVEPSDLWTLSFRLSFAASLALAAVLPALRPVGAVGWVRAALIASVVAQVATVPTILPTFGTLSVVSVPANLLVGPIVTVLFPLAGLVALSGLVVPALSEALAVPARLGAEGVFVVVDGFAAAPLADIGMPFFGDRVSGFGLSVVGAVVVTVVSREGRRWIGRSARLSAAERDRLVIAVLAGLAGVVLVVAVGWVW